jgi:hypothetical protein
MLIVDAVLRRNVEVELSEAVGGLRSDQGAIVLDNLEPGAQVLELDIVGVGHGKIDGSSRSVAKSLSDNVDRRLVLSLGAG